MSFISCKTPMSKFPCCKAFIAASIPPARPNLMISDAIRIPFSSSELFQSRLSCFRTQKSAYSRLWWSRACTSLFHYARSTPQRRPFWFPKTLVHSFVFKLPSVCLPPPDFPSWPPFPLLWFPSPDISTFPSPPTPLVSPPPLLPGIPPPPPTVHLMDLRASQTGQ